MKILPTSEDIDLLYEACKGRKSDWDPRFLEAMTIFPYCFKTYNHDSCEENNSSCEVRDVEIS